MDIERSLLMRMIAVGGVDLVVSEGVEAQHFADEELRAIFTTCTRHYHAWRDSPSIDAIARRHPDFKLLPVSDELGYLIKEFRLDSEWRVGVEKWRDIGDMLDRAEGGDQEAREGVAASFSEHAREMAMRVPVPRSSKMSEMANRILTIKSQQDSGVMPGVPIGIPQVDRYVVAVRPTEVCIHCGYSGRGKTTGLVRSGVAAYEAGEQVLFLSLEMEQDEVWEMFDAKVADLSREAISRRELGEDDYGRYEEAAVRVKNAPNEVVVLDEVGGGATIDKLAALVDLYKPTVVCVDYISLMKSLTSKTSDWERVSEISHALKQLARAYKIVVYAAAQNNRQAADEGPTEENIAFSSTIYQDCNIMVGYHQDPEMEKINKMQVRLIKHRRGRKGPIGDSGYSEFSEMWDRDRLHFEDWSSTHEWTMKERSKAQ